MKKSFLLALCLLTIGSLGFSIAEDEMPAVATKAKIAEIQDFSVTIHAGNSQGSGEIKTRNGVNYVWTAGHVIAGLRETREVIDSRTGTRRVVVEFRDAKVVKELIEDGRSVGRLEMDAEVLRYSNSTSGEDLALLRIRKRNFVKSSVEFYLKDKFPDIGDTLYHCGSLLGQIGSNSFTRGIMSQHGRVVEGKVYDQTTCAAFPGSSGGGIYTPNGKMVGMIVRGAGETFNLMIPVRRMHEWAKRAGVEFAIDDKVAVPTEEQLRKIPIEETGNSKLDNSHKKIDEKKNFHFLLYTLNK